MTSLEDRLYLALMGARTIVSATANVNPQAHRILRLIDAAAANYKQLKEQEEPQDMESADAAGN